MATATDPRGIGRGCDNLAGPDPQMNASRILAWAICWPWNLLWTVCVFNPICYALEIAVREFRSALEQISSGQFREVEHELIADDAALPVVVSPHSPQWSTSAGSVDSDRPALVVGDPLPGWKPVPDQHTGHAIVEAESAGGSMPTLQSLVGVSHAAPRTDSSVNGTVTNDCGSVGASGAVQAAVENVNGSRNWMPPAVSLHDSGTSTPETWSPVGELNDAPKVASASLSPNARKPPSAARSAVHLPSSLFDAWYHLPAAKDGSGQPPLN